MFRSRTSGPSGAERILSVLTSSHSMTVVSDGVATQVRRLDGTGIAGAFHLHDTEPPTGRTEGERIPVRLEFTDVAPTPVRDRVRARVTITGLLAAPYEADAESTCMEFGQAVVETAEGREYVTLDALHEAAPDPLARAEAGMLTHLIDSHSELVPLLLRLVRRPAGLTRAVPVAVDRYGITLRLERERTHQDVRLAFATTLTRPEQAGPQIQALLSKARRLSHANTLNA